MSCCLLFFVFVYRILLVMLFSYFYVFLSYFYCLVFLLLSYFIYYVLFVYCVYFYFDLLFVIFFLYFYWAQDPFFWLKFQPNLTRNEAQAAAKWSSSQRHRPQAQKRQASCQARLRPAGLAFFSSPALPACFFYCWPRTIGPCWPAPFPFSARTWPQATVLLPLPFLPTWSAPSLPIFFLSRMAHDQLCFFCFGPAWSTMLCPFLPTWSIRPCWPFLWLPE